MKKQRTNEYGISEENALVPQLHKSCRTQLLRMHRAHRVKKSREIKRKCLDRGNDPVAHNVKRKKISQSNSVNGPRIVLQGSQTLACKGLRYLGNSCYFNAIIQCLFHCPTFTTAIGKLPLEVFSVDVINHLRILFRNITSTGSLPYVTPEECLTSVLNTAECKAAGMLKGPQQDASEFLCHLLEDFHQKCRTLSNLFEGQFVSTHKCQLCSHSYLTNQSFRQYTLQMDVPLAHGTQTLDLYNLIDNFHRAEVIEDFPCRGCDSEDSTEKQLSIIALPKILVIHLARFRGLEKINDFVRFPEQASINYKIDNSEYNKQYRSMGMVVNIGSSIAQGHYVSFVRVGENWMRADDEIVTGIRFQNVRRKKAYILFYEQV